MIRLPLPPAENRFPYRTTQSLPITRSVSNRKASSQYRLVRPLRVGDSLWRGGRVAETPVVLRGRYSLFKYSLASS